ncbi:MAG: hypothetical protein JOY90_30915, partial [Bradyrhizobium sp.]|uniref:hypothetical protein n=1 Tax=Bradyrhizobium sp. TaxID=376 RepID=UPI001DD94609
MSYVDLPKHIIEKFEHRWASHVAEEAAVWRSNKSDHPAHRTVISRKGRVVPVAVKRPSLRGPRR